MVESSSPEVLQWVEQLAEGVSDRLDHPELWEELWSARNEQRQALVALTETLQALLTIPQGPDAWLVLSVLSGVLEVCTDQVERGEQRLDGLFVQHSHDVLVAGALYFAQGKAHPERPRVDLRQTLCRKPFEQCDVLDGSTHLCCASWLTVSAGNLHEQPWQAVWNSERAQAVRAGIHDGSYRHCNKMLCPHIQAGTLPRKQQLAEDDATFGGIIAEERCTTPAPQVVNLAYDRTCNLSCPSCRTERYAAGEAERERFARLQETNILPMLEGARQVTVTGSGDPFASRNFRKLLASLDPARFPRLKVHMMTNAMLLTEAEWQKFSHLSGRISTLRVSVDAATGPTHERLRRGARWNVMLDNLHFIGRLRREGHIDRYELSFVVQVDNFEEMPAAVDLAEAVGADKIDFLGISNWGTYSPEDFRKLAVMHPAHHQHARFLEVLQDRRLWSERAWLPSLRELLPTKQEKAS